MNRFSQPQPQPIAIPYEIAFEALGCLVRCIDRSKFHFNTVIGKVVDHTEEAIRLNDHRYEEAIIISEILDDDDIDTKKIKPEEYIMHDLHALANIVELPAAGEAEQTQIFDYVRNAIVSAKDVAPTLCASTRSDQEIKALEENDRNIQEGIRFYRGLCIMRLQRKNHAKLVDDFLTTKLSVSESILLGLKTRIKPQKPT